MHLGEKIKHLRKARKITLTALSQSSGVQIATLSRIENGKMTGTLDSHMAIARALGTDITELYKDLDAAKPSAVQPEPQPEAAESFSYNDKASYEILTTQLLSKKMMPVVLRIEPDGATNPEQNRPGAEKFIFVLEGNVTVHIGGRTYPLRANQTLYFDASLNHWLTNSGDVTVKLISIITPVEL